MSGIFFKAFTDFILENVLFLPDACFFLISLTSLTKEASLETKGLEDLRDLIVLLDL